MQMIVFVEYAKRIYYESVFFRNLYLRTTKIDLTLSLLIIIATFGVDG